ncbi:head GIN domain-containing protein [Flavobacterium sp.]|uniref:head GIN domain-containing protein n=1 Tax=Flavobacterium sp. TaxID=239 RepID=UPI002611FF2E|nr:head GIN domain-containing protein [Flavobacterium sp.]
MKKLFILSFLSVTTFVSAQITKNVGDFTKVTAFDKISVQLIASEENKIEIKGNLANDVEVINANGELKIRMPLGKLLKGDDIVAKVYFIKLEGLEANEGSYISCETELKALDFGLIAKEGAQIRVNVDAQRIAVKSSNGAIIKLSGKAQNINVVINSGGVLEAKNCKTSQAVVSVNAGGSADVTASDLVDAKTRAGGTITIYGNPKQVNQKTVLGGSIIISKR